MPSNSRPAGTSNAVASATTVGNSGERAQRSILEIAVECRPERCERSSWDQPRSLRSSFTFSAIAGLLAGGHPVHLASTLWFEGIVIGLLLAEELEKRRG
jgi:hypothetical protein